MQRYEALRETGGLEEAIRTWVGSFEARPAGESKSIRLSADSVALRRVKDFGSEWLWYITCESPTHPEQGIWAWSGWATKDEADKWIAHAIAGGGGHPLLTGCPSVNLGCQLLEDGFRAGGWVESVGRQITEVRLLDPTGHELSDRIQNQVALLRSHRPVELPLTVQLIDATGVIATTQQFP
ncbi:MAG TPA: hypothetical protein VJ935_12920 [Acidimicrobiia bacterium]|nr:hypothetical protein [Acidimicrobiia bacterium]